MLFHTVLSFPDRDIVSSDYQGKNHAANNSPTFHEYWKMYVSHNGMSSAVPPPLKPSPHGAEGEYDDDDDFESEDADDNLVRSDGDKGMAVNQRETFRNTATETPKEVDTRDAPEPASKLPTDGGKAVRSDSQEFEASSTCPYTNACGDVLQCDLEPTWRYQRLTRVDPDGQCFYHAVGRAVGTSGPEVFRKASHWLNCEFKASPSSTCASTTGLMLIDMFTADAEGNVVLEHTASVDSIFAVCACHNLRLFIWDTLQYSPRSTLHPTVVQRVVLPHEALTLDDVHVLRHYSIDGAGVAQPHYDLVHMVKVHPKHSASPTCGVIGAAGEHHVPTTSTSVDRHGGPSNLGTARCRLSPRAYNLYNCMVWVHSTVHPFSSIVYTFLIPLCSVSCFIGCGL